MTTTTFIAESPKPEDRTVIAEGTGVSQVLNQLEDLLNADDWSLGEVLNSRIYRVDSNEDGEEFKLLGTVTRRGFRLDMRAS